MILQYYLSIYSINFFTSPTFSNFKVRLINQQNGDCNDSIMLNTQFLNSSTFPVKIKLKGSERLLMKIKIIAFKTKQVEIVIGQGVVNIDKNTIQNSIRVPIYDKNQGIEQVAICSVDFFVSGNHISKNVSIALDKSKSKIEDWRDHTEDAVYSQMSYTVQSENQRAEVETLVKNTNQKDNRKIQNASKNAKSVESQYANSRKLSQRQKDNSPSQKDNSPSQKDNYKKVEYLLQPESPLQNSAYLSQTPSPNKKNPIKKETLPEQLQNKNQSILKEDRKQEQTIDAQNLRKKLEQQQKITKQLKRYLAKHKQKQRNYSTQIKTQKHKIRRKELKIEQISSYKSQGKYIKYFSQPDQKHRFFIKNVKAYQITHNDVRENNESLGVEIPINKFNLSTISNNKIVSFDSLGYRAYCITNYIKEYPIQITIPQTEEGLKVNVQLNNFGTFQGIIGVQEGQNMAVILKPKQNDKNNVLSALRKQVYKLTFNIKLNGSYLDIQKTIKCQKNDISYREQNSISQPQTSIKDRILSFSIQPWGYGYSYLNQKNVNQNDILSKIKQKKKLIQTQAKKRIEESNAESDASKESNKKQALKNVQQIKKDKKLQFHYREEQLKNTQLVTNHALNKQKKKMKSQLKSSQKQYQSLQNIKMARKEINQIMSIRNGNRNNFKLKKQNEQKKPNIKQMWEKLLIKKKLQQEGSSEKQRLKLQARKSPASRFTNQDRSNQSSTIQDNDSSPAKSKLYSVLPGGSRVLTVKKEERLSNQEHLAPLRTITIQIKNISITQPLAIVSQQLGEMAGKFIKLQIKDKIVYYTEIIFNGQFNSILWKLSRCLFNQLTGNQQLEIEIYKTVENKIVMLGKTSIRVSKLYFLRNNHIYNGKIIFNKILNGEFTLGFEVQQNFPFEVIKEENQEGKTDYLLMPKSTNKNVRIKQSQVFKKQGRMVDDRRDQSFGSISPSQAKKIPQNHINNQNLFMRSKHRVQLKDTLRKDYNMNRKSNKVIEESLEVGVSELQQSSWMPEGLSLPQQEKKR